MTWAASSRCAPALVRSHFGEICDFWEKKLSDAVWCDSVIEVMTLCPNVHLHIIRQRIPWYCCTTVSGVLISLWVWVRWYRVHVHGYHFSGISGNPEMSGNWAKVSEKSGKGLGICVVSVIWYKMLVTKLWYELWCAWTRSQIVI